MDTVGNAWSLRAVSSLVSRSDVDDVEDLFVDNPGRRRRVWQSMCEDPFTPDGATLPCSARVVRGGGREPAFAARVLNRIFDRVRVDRLHACFSSWVRIHRRSDGTGLEGLCLTKGLRGDSVRVASSALRLGLRSASRRVGAESDAAALLLRMIFNAFAAAAGINQDKVVARSRFRDTQVRNLGRRMHAWDIERCSLLLHLMWRIWRSYASCRFDPDVASNAPTSSPSSLRRGHCLKQAEAAVALLLRFGRQSLAEQCLLLWRTFVAEGLAMQVIVMRERLQRADAECCILRGEDEKLRSEAERCKALVGEAEIRSALAEGELRRRSQEEFAQIRDMQMELAKLRAKSVASTAPIFHLDPVSASVYSMGSAAVATAKTPQAIATIAGGMVASFTASSVRAWLRLYLLAWRGLAAIYELVLAVASQSVSVDACLLAGRALALWRRSIQQERSQVAIMRLAEILQKQYLLSLLRAVLRSWHAHIDRISCLVTPLSLRDSSAMGGSPLTATTNSASHTGVYHSAVAARTGSLAASPLCETPYDRGASQGIPTHVRASNGSTDGPVVPVQLWPSASSGVAAESGASTPAYSSLNRQLEEPFGPGGSLHRVGIGVSSGPEAEICGREISSDPTSSSRFRHDFVADQKLASRPR